MMRPEPNASKAAAGNHADDPAIPATDVVNNVRTLLERNPHFHAHTSEIAVELDGHTLILTGQLSSFYLKQLLQESLRNIDGIEKIDNQVNVVC